MRDTITYTEQAADVLASAALAIAAKTPFALITSVAISGGSARPLGSLAMVTADGQMTGYLSNGCIDRDIQARGIAAVESGERAVLQYGHGSQFMDLKLPCGGALKVLIDPAPDAPAIVAAAKALQRRDMATLTFQLPDAPIPQISFTYRPKFRVVLAGRGAAFRATASVAHAAGFQVSVLSPEAEDLSVLAPLTFDRPWH